ncbi:hypothetical protein, partial [Endobacter medicaginis]
MRMAATRRLQTPGWRLALLLGACPAIMAASSVAALSQTTAPHAVHHKKKPAAHRKAAAGPAATA